MAVSALIVAAGKGERAGSGTPKQFRLLDGRPVVRLAAEAMLAHPSIDDVRVVVAKDHLALAAEALSGLDLAPFVIGGENRSDSVQAGLDAISGSRVLIHDAARPFCPSPVIDRLLASLELHDGAAPVLPVSDTLAKATDRVEAPVDRAGLVRVQTPQAFHLEPLRRAYAQWTGPPPTDETTVARMAGLSVAAVEGDMMLDKITTAADFHRAETLLNARRVPRTGTGFDVHRFAGEGPLMLGGVPVPFDRGLEGHSDADVVLHAITDALLGAASLGDIGMHFPPSDQRWQGASSDRFLSHAAVLVRDMGGTIDHVDCTVIAQAPKLGPYRQAIRTRIAEILGVRPDQISVKATTTDGLGFTGRSEGIAAQAVANVRMGPRS